MSNNSSLAAVYPLTSVEPFELANQPSLACLLVHANFGNTLWVLSHLSPSSAFGNMPATHFVASIPNPDSVSDPEWTNWNTYIARHCVPTCDEEVVRRYQNIEQRSSKFLEARYLNHFLNLRHFTGNSTYASIAADFFDIEEDSYPVDASVDALEALYLCKGCRFTADSTVFKGVSSEPFYEIHSFELAEVGQEILFPGFLSTTVCREKALNFAGRQGVLLTIQGLDLVDCIVPVNSRVKTTIGASVPEHEVLLRRGVSMKVRDVTPATAGRPREIHLQVIGQP